MRNAKAVKRFSSSLNGLQGQIALFPRGGSEFLFSVGYKGYYEELQGIRDSLEDLGLYEVILGAITYSEMLARDGKYDEAETLVLEANRTLSNASGRDDELRRIYKASND